MRKNHHVFLSAFLCALLVFTVYVLLDTFVIERRMEVVTEPQTVNAQLGGETGTTVSDTPVSLQLAASQEETAEPVITENSYLDGDIPVVIAVLRYNSLHACALFRRGGKRQSHRRNCYVVDLRAHGLRPGGRLDPSLDDKGVQQHIDGEEQQHTQKRRQEHPFSVFHD